MKLFRLLPHVSFYSKPDSLTHVSFYSKSVCEQGERWRPRMCVLRYFSSESRLGLLDLWRCGEDGTGLGFASELGMSPGMVWLCVAAFVNLRWWWSWSGERRIEQSSLEVIELPLELDEVE